MIARSCPEHIAIAIVIGSLVNQLNADTHARAMKTQVAS